MIYLLSEARLKKDFLNDNIASELILPSIQTAQDIYLRQTLGDSLLDKICNLVREDELQEPYKTLLDEYIIIYLEYLAMAELCVPSTFKLGNIGIAQAYDSNVNTSTIQNVKYLESYYKQKASFYENRLTTFIQQHCNLFPEYNTITDVTVSTESTLQCGIYLGGTSKKRTIINKSNNNNTEVGNYVRYDKAQNLSELEKAQARENIGVSANGDIVVDLENYYTKDEVFNKTEINTKLVPYITTNEVNLRLNSYYDKSQVDNAIETAISNIDIPDTSNYYTKSEVNDLIDNVTSGDIDLTNYYTKEETYSKEEVDNLVANSGGGSGEGNTTTVSISSNYITDIGLGGNDDLEFVYNEFFNTDKEFTDGLITYRGVQVNNFNSDGDTLTFTHTAIGDDNLVDSFKVDINKSITYKDFTVRTYPNIPNNEIWYRTNNEQPFYLEKENIISNEYDSELGLFKIVFDGGIQIGIHNELFSKYEGDDTLTEVYFGNESFVPYACFKNCRALEKVELPFGGENNFNDGGDFNSTFVNCKNLKEIIIPFNVYGIYNDTFQNCINLKTIVFLGYPISIPYPDTIGTNVYRGKKIYYNQNYELPIELVTISEKYGFEIIGVEDFTNVPINNFEATYTEQPENNININGGGGGGSTDLSNYYNKQQVDTLISNVPTFSGDYEDLTNKPSIYTQNEIDTLISNINGFSGDYNDLTNKPTIPTDTNQLNKSDVYTKTEVDNLISEVPTFSGDYNDLSNTPTLFDGDYNSLENKPDLFSGSYDDLENKPELFSGNYEDLNNIPTLFSGSYTDLTNKPELFSGSYTDLSDKPTIPTATSQLTLDNVYNKSEIDLQFESVNATLGDINNLLETI